MKLRRAFPIALIVFMSSQPAFAQWVSNGVGVCTTVLTQTDPVIIPDGSGGVIIAWEDFRNGHYDVFAQRLNASGVRLWAVDGVAVCTAASGQVALQLIPDGAGGAIICWHDYRGLVTADIYVQRVNASGIPQWTANGVALCTAAGDQLYPTIVSDGAGGAIVCWHDLRGGAFTDIYAQRVNASGAPQWLANGVGVCIATSNQYLPTITSDGAAGAIVSWYDFRSGNYDIYARRVTANGTGLWNINGNPLCTVANTQGFPQIVSDNAGGAIVVWHDERAGVPSSDVYAQHVNSLGTALWATNGVGICTAANNQMFPQIAPDGSGGAIISWHDNRTANGFDIYVQKITGAGAPQWTGDGVALCTATNDQLDPRVVSDGAGGGIVAWRDARTGAEDIYAQRIDVSGLIQWTGNGAAISTAASDQLGVVIASNGTDGAILSWSDLRAASIDIYAQRVEGTYGYWGYPEPIVTSVADVPNDQGGHVAVNWKASGRDDTVPRTVDRYTIWRAVDPLLTGMPQTSTVFKSVRDVPADAVPPIYIATPSTSPPPYYWELVGTQAAHGWPGYSFLAETRADNTPQFFMVAAHVQFDDFIAFTSNAMSGQSVDNLAPSSPFLLTAQRIGNYVYLRWNGVTVPDLRDYSVYRASASGVTPVPINFLASSEDTVLADVNPPASTLYYIVTAVDVHQNQSAPSNEASVGSATDAGNLPPVTTLTVLQNHPNPFTEATELRVGLPVKADITVELFDVVGRRVRRELLPQQPKGWNSVRLDARDDRGAALPSGVYFYRVHAGQETVARKMVIAR